jgi:hypothetical protein
MRKVFLLTALAAVGVAGVAYAITYSNTYTVFTKFSPTKSGTKAHPSPIGTSVSFAVGTLPAGQRPKVVRTYKIKISGIRENTNSFPVCASSRLLAKGQGPSTCLKGSKVGSGHVIIEVGPTSNTSASYSAFCSAGASIYNSGHHHLSLYVFKGSFAGRPACPLPGPSAITVTLVTSKSGVTGIFTVPLALRHFPTGNDDAITSGVLSVPVHKRKIGTKTVGFLASVACPANHQRQTGITFTEENNSSHTATRNFVCS